MNTKLTFEITTLEGNIRTHELFTAPEDVDSAIQQQLAMYAKVGMLKRVGNRYTLLPCGQIAQVEIDIPSVVIAHPGEADKATKGKISLI